MQPVQLQVVARVHDNAQSDSVSQECEAVGHARAAEASGQHDDIFWH
jgi:hypothetical protein